MTKPIITVEHIGHIDIDISNGDPKVGKAIIIDSIRMC